MATVRLILQFEKETERKAVYTELVGPGWFAGMVYLDKMEVRKMYGGEVPKFIRMEVQIAS